MKILLVAHEFPYPSNHGGKVDIWNRMQAFKSIGAEIFLVTWDRVTKKDITTDEDIAVVKRVVSNMILFPAVKGLARILGLFRFPSDVSSRLLKSANYNRVLHAAKEFKPDFVFIDGLFAGTTGIRLAKDLSIPCGLRSHNIEHLYMYGLLKKATGLKEKLGKFAANLHLKKYEYRTLSSVNSFFDISLDDLAFWHSEGLTNGVWLPPIYCDNNSIAETDTEQYDIGFIGNLYTSNNLEGLNWFINLVLPIICEKIPNVKFLIMGANPSEAFVRICDLNKNITLISNPKNPEIYLKNTTVLINPVQFGSGVNIKTIDMIFRDSQIVSTSVGIKGLPKEISEVFFIANNPNEFADSTIDILKHGAKKSSQKREQFRTIFHPRSVKKIFDTLFDQSYTANKVYSDS
jgi:hypothetical protein